MNKKKNDNSIAVEPHVSGSLSDREINIVLSTIKIDRANLEHISKTGRLNGSLLVELRQFARTIEKLVLENYR